MRIPDQSIQMQFRSVRRRFTGRYRRAVGPIEVTALLNVVVLVGLFQLLTIPASAQMLARAHLRTRPPGYDDAPRRVADITDATDRQY